MRETLVGLMLAFVLSVAAVSAESYGTLPPDAISIAEQSGVHAEICRDHFLDPAQFKFALPRQYTLLTAGDLSADDPALAAFLKAKPQYVSHHVGSLCFMLSDNFSVDGARAFAADRPAPMAFWWVHAKRTGDTDPRMRGRAEWIQLASWYSREGNNRALITKTDPMAQYVDLEVAETRPGAWHARLELADQVIEAVISVSGQPKKRAGQGPRFMTVAHSGSAAEYFSVFTYFGHHHQSAEGKWTAKGTGSLAGAFNVPDEATAFGTFFQSQWQALSGLYKAPNH